MLQRTCRTGDIRRRLELSNPESFPTSEELEVRREFASDVMLMGLNISMIFMILGAVIVAFVSTRYMGYTGFNIAFFGTLLDVLCGALIAYHFGSRQRMIV